MVKLNNGIEMPSLGLGVWRLNEPGAAYNSVLAALECGYRLIDTAAIYRNEEEVGRAIKDSSVPRREIFLTTKIWNDDQRDGRVVEAFETSLSKLGMDYVDLYLIHWPYPNRYIECWEKMIDLYQDGLIRAIGASNFSAEILEDVKRQTSVIPAVNQVELHPLAAQVPLRQYCEKEGIQVEAWSPLMQGGFDHPLFAELSEKYGKSPAQIILRWHIGNGVVAIPRSRNAQRIRQNADIFDFTLEEQDIQRIDAMDIDKHFGSTLQTFEFR